MEERRKLKRWYLNHPLKVLNVENDQPLGHAANISAEGILLKSKQPVKVNTNFRLRMLFPEKSDNNGYFEFSAESKWWEKNINPE